MIEHQLKSCNKNLNKKSAVSSYYASQKQSRKCEDPVRFTQTTQDSSDNGFSAWICKNATCKAVLSINDAFCRRCCCSICHQVGDKRDPSVWLVCESDSASEDYCGLSCHIECAFEQEKLGVVNLGQFMQLDGSFWCASCGKVSGILECWKKQLAIAKDAWRVDVLCYRVFLSYRLLNGTSRFKELHQIITEAKTKLEAEVGPMNAESVTMPRGIVSRLAVALDVQKLCSNAIAKADEYLLKIPKLTSKDTVEPIPAACRFLFEEIASSSLVIVLIKIPSPSTNYIKGYKLWYSKTGEETFSKDRPAIIPRNKTRIYVKNLLPCTEYSFRVQGYTETGDLGHSEAKCFTKSAEITDKKNPATDLAGPSSQLIARESLAKVHLKWAKKQARCEGFCSANIEKCCGVIKCEFPNDRKTAVATPVIRELDLNVVSMPDLNDDITPPLDSSRDEDNGPDDDAASHGIERNGLGNVAQAWPPTQNGDIGSSRRKRDRNAIEENYDGDSTPMNGSPFRLSIGSRSGSGIGPESLDGSLEFCVKIIRWLECLGFIDREFRLKLLTWFCLNSSEQERRIVNTFIQILKDDPKSLAGQLIDSFADIISIRRY